MGQPTTRIVVTALGATSALLCACSLLFPFDDFSNPSDAGSDAAGDADAGCAAPLLQCGTECIDPRTDDGNCGACGNVCKNTTCGASFCKPFTGVGGGVVPAGIVFDGTYVYWAVARSGTEGSYVYRLKPDDVAAGLDGSAPTSRNLGGVTATHLVQARSGELVYSTEDRVPGSDAGPQPASVRFFRFDLGGGAKSLGQLPGGDIVSGLALRDGDAGANVVWVSETVDGGNPKLGLHLGTIATDGGGVEVDASYGSFVYNGGSAVPLPHAGPVARGGGNQLLLVGADDATTWSIQRLEQGLDGNWTIGSSSAMLQQRINGLAWDGKDVLWTSENTIWSAPANVSSQSKVANIGSAGDVLRAISGDVKDTYVLSAPATDRTKGRLWRRRRDTGTVTMVGTATVDGDGAVLVTDAWVFWVSAGDLRFLAR